MTWDCSKQTRTTSYWAMSWEILRWGLGPTLVSLWADILSSFVQLVSLLFIYSANSKRRNHINLRTVHKAKEWENKERLLFSGVWSSRAAFCSIKTSGVNYSRCKSFIWIWIRLVLGKHLLFLFFFWKKRHRPNTWGSKRQSFWFTNSSLYLFSIPFK